MLMIAAEKYAVLKAKDFKSCENHAEEKQKRQKKYE